MSRNENGARGFAERPQPRKSIAIVRKCDENAST